MTVSQILTEMQLCKPRGRHICDCEEIEPYEIPLHPGNTHRGQTHGTTSHLPLESYFDVPVKGQSLHKNTL